MVENIKFSVALLDQILDEARRSDLKFVEKAGLYAALEALVKDINTHIAEEHAGANYANEKISNFAWSVRAILGFSNGNGHLISQHVSWALGEMSTLRNVLKLDD